MPPLRWTPKAAQDLEDIKAYIPEDDPDAALAVVGDIVNRADQLERFPDSGSPMRAKRWPKDKMRYLVVHSYLIFYRPNGERVAIIRVLHARQDYLSILRGDA